MQTPSLRPQRCLLALVLALTAQLTPLRAQQYGSDVSVGVRSHLDRQKKIWDGTSMHRLENPPEHGKRYAILMIQPTKSKDKLVKPVNAAIIRDELVKQLNAHGYTPVAPGQKPEILVSVTYGRSWLPNPYFTAKTDVDNMGPEEEPTTADPTNPKMMPSAPQGIVVNDPNLAANLSIPANRHRATIAGFEKLFIIVRAFRYPPPVDPKQKPEILWVSTMYVDDPAHRDLNAVAQQMLEAGAPYFDREIKDPEVFVTKPFPEGHVKVGAPQVVEPAKR